MSSPWISQPSHASALVHILVTNYFANLSSILVAFDGASLRSELQHEYLTAVQQALSNRTQRGGHAAVTLQWLNVATLDADQLGEQMLRAVDSVTEGFITILSNTSRFLHARYYATRYAELRLKDKFYLFLCEDENPEDFLQLEILQFLNAFFSVSFEVYPHHLMVAPRQTSMIVTAEQDEEGRNLSSTVAETPAIGLNNNFASASGVQPTGVQRGIGRGFWEGRELRKHQDINFELWTQKFVGVTGNLDAVHLDSFGPGRTFARNVQLFPDKLRNMEGRSLRVGSITYIPYVVTNYVAAGEGNVDPINSNGPNRSILYAGSEANLVMTFCRVHHCHLRMKAYGVDNWGLIYENETATGMLGDVLEQRVELAIGCIYNWYNNITETSHTIARSAVTILGPAPAKFPAWRTNIMPFSPQLWYFVIFTIVSCACFLHLIKFTRFKLQNQDRGRFRHYNSFEQAMLDVFAIFLQQSSVDESLSGLPARFFLATLLIATITVENTYSGELKSILTVPFYTDSVDTMAKWAATTWRWGAPSFIWVQSIDKSDLRTEQILEAKFEVRDHGFLYNASFRNDYGLGIERLMSGSFSFGDYLTEAALATKIIPKDDLYFDWTRAVAIRGWPLMPQFDRHVRACMETGLFVHWEREMVARSMDRHMQEVMAALASRNVPKSPAEKLTLENVSGAMFALLFGYVFALLALLLELFGHVIMRKILRMKRSLKARIRGM